MIKIFSGSANPQLAAKISDILKIPLSKSQITRFDNSEFKVRVLEKVKDKTCFLIQSTSNPTDTNLMELFFFADVLRKNAAKEIIAIIPYFGYARQNREYLPGESVSVNVVIRFIEAIGFKAVYTVNIHDEATAGIFSIKFKNINAFEILAPKIKKYLSQKNIDNKVIIVSPDQGGIKRAHNFSDVFFNGQTKDIAVIEKKRSLEVIHQSKALNLYGEVKNKTCIIVDDIITSGNTLVNAAEFCLKKGAKRVIACVVHHDFSPKAKDVLSKSPIEKIFTTNSIALKPEQHFKQLEETSIAPLIAKEIKEIV
ncbi:MAG: ribose-phosphate pyrophosphokinase [Patescibacteria group bacterium]|nr:ribose-phosphate pyrophosphokinase [Patescibacteria group bacterium]